MEASDEAVLGQISLFSHLRPDEIGRIARRFRILELAQGDRRAFGRTRALARLVVVLRGELEVDVGHDGSTATSRLLPGDRFGEVALLTGHPRVVTAVATRAARVALINRASFDRVLADFPAVALPLAAELARELHTKDDAVRQLLELVAERLPEEEMRAAIAERKSEIGRRRAPLRRLSPRALFERLVVQQGAEPPFWMLVGFIASLGGARLVVFLILKYHLENQLFALIPGTDPNPMHVHHFNYGLVLIGVSGLAALVPFGRRALRGLAVVFGIGCGLVFDEFALFWNLNPEYSQSLSLIAAALAAAVLVQLTWFRRFWFAVARRAYLLARRR